MSSIVTRWLIALGKLVIRIGFSALLVAFAVFAAASAVPVDPARALLGPMADEAAVAALRRELGMEVPFVIQFVRWVVRLMHGDFGYSPFHQRPALDVVMDLVPLSLSRLGLSMGLGMLIGALLGFQTFSARAFSRTLYSSTLAVPAFALAACSLWLAARTFGATPLSAPWLYQVLTIGIAALPTGLAIATTLSQWLHGDRPLTRTRQYLELAGAPEPVILRNLVREATPATFAVIANSIVPALTAVTFCEFVFSLKGFGAIFLTACQKSDLPIVVAGTLITLALLIPAQVLSEQLSSVIGRRLARAH